MVLMLNKLTEVAHEHDYGQLERRQATGGANAKLVSRQRTSVHAWPRCRDSKPNDTVQSRQRAKTKDAGSQQA